MRGVFFIVLAIVLWPLRSPAEVLYSTNVGTPGDSSAIVQSGGRLGALFFNPDVDRTLDYLSLRVSGSGGVDFYLYSSTAGASGLPDEELMAFGPVALPGGLQTPTLDGGDFLLEADTYYWIVFVAQGLGMPAWSYTNSAGSGEGFVFGRAVYFGSTPAWEPINSISAFKMEIGAVPVPEPGVVALCGMAGAMLCLRRRRVQACTG
jgi:hypothetical protein